MGCSYTHSYKCIQLLLLMFWGPLPPSLTYVQTKKNSMWINKNYRFGSVRSLDFKRNKIIFYQLLIVLYYKLTNKSGLWDEMMWDSSAKSVPAFLQICIICIKYLNAKTAAFIRETITVLLERMCVSVFMYHVQPAPTPAALENLHITSRWAKGTHNKHTMYIIWISIALCTIKA